MLIHSFTKDLIILCNKHHHAQMNYPRLHGLKHPLNT